MKRTVDHIDGRIAVPYIAVYTGTVQNVGEGFCFTYGVRFVFCFIKKLLYPLVDFIGSKTRILLIDIVGTLKTVKAFYRSGGTDVF